MWPAKGNGMEITMTKQNTEMSFESFYNKYYMQACYYVQKKITNPQDAEDLTCEAFLYCYKRFFTYDPDKASYGTWLYLVINSRIKNYYRDHKAYVELEKLEQVLGSGDDFPGQALLLQEQRNFLAKAIKTLPQQQQEIIILKYFYNKTSQEIALRVGLSPSNVRVTLSRALKKLERFYNENEIL